MAGLDAGRAGSRLGGARALEQRAVVAGMTSAEKMKQERFRTV